VITIPDGISREDAIKTARILAKALEHARADNRQLMREYAELMEHTLSMARLIHEEV